ncbi:lysosomal alpha-mannosidase [Drosophila willistoni]|uniref:lysosomal alpha-mannosidase n=1 Tax=Drosophila willistoni TaxID=7260 RepID=UPI001F074D49|nr:lysosomal alpha-mannosidase [Drosophila willistoni]
MKYLGYLLFVVFLTANIEQSIAVCGYEACHDTVPGMINVHIVPHSHDDVGWQKTVEQYFYGHRNVIHHGGVQYIIDSVVQALLKNPERRFIQVESVFFSKWWNEQSEVIKQIVQQLTDEGRLEFTGGAWSMNDEAATNYQSVIDQFTLGLKFLDDNLGSCARPRIGWQVDPFGHSREQASIFAQMGFDGEFFARMDETDKAQRLEKLNMEMIWQASESLSNHEIFTGLLYRHYSSPTGFCFDVHCVDYPIIDTDSYENNVKDRTDEFIRYLDQVAPHFRSNHIMVPFGGDFQFEDAEYTFRNLDRLIKYINERQSDGDKYNMLYSTPACYLKAVHDSVQTYPNKTLDFFPLATDNNSFWTGYFTSRTTQKRFERTGNHMLQVAKQLSSFAHLTSEERKKELDSLRSIMGIMQHHDAITGTEKQAVSDDYDYLMYNGIIGASNNARDALRQLTNLPNGEFENCLQLNISVCAFTKDSADNVVVTLFNPLAHTTSQYVRIPVKDESYEVTDEQDRTVASEVVPVAWPVLALEYRSNDTQHELVFEASVDKIAHYFIKKVDNAESSIAAMPKKSKILTNNDKFNDIAPYDDDDSEETVVQNSLIKLTFDNKSGRLKTVEMNGVTESIEQKFAVYKTKDSGAYLFRTNGEAEEVEDDVEFTVYEGALVKEVHQQVNEYISQVIRIYEGVNRVEFEWLVGPIPTDSDTAREIVTLFKSGISSDGVFYTDANGRELIWRKKDKREDYDPDLSVQPISGNFYPVTSRMVLEDSNKRIALLTDRAQGGTSLKNGQLELMLHRRLIRDDDKGVGETLNEQKFGNPLIARGKVHLILNTVGSKASAAERLAEKQLHLPLWEFFSKKSSVDSNAVAKAIPDFNDFPPSVHLLTLEPFSQDEVLFRVENFMDHNEGKVVSFNIRSIFDTLNGLEIRETTLDGNLPLSEMKRFKFYHDGSGVVPTEPQYSTASHKPLAADKSQEAYEFSVTLKPMQIRTFIIKRE